MRASWTPPPPGSLRPLRLKKKAKEKRCGARGDGLEKWTAPSVQFISSIDWEMKSQSRISCQRLAATQVALSPPARTAQRCRTQS